MNAVWLAVVIALVSGIAWAAAHLIGIAWMYASHVGGGRWRAARLGLLLASSAFAWVAFVLIASVADQYLATPVSELVLQLAPFAGGAALLSLSMVGLCWPGRDRHIPLDAGEPNLEHVAFVHDIILAHTPAPKVPPLPSDMEMQKFLDSGPMILARHSPFVFFMTLVVALLAGGAWTPVLIMRAARSREAWRLERANPDIFVRVRLHAGAVFHARRRGWKEDGEPFRLP